MAFNQQKYINDYLIENYGNISIRLKKETVEAFKKKCKENGESQATVLGRAIDEYLKG